MSERFKGHTTELLPCPLCGCAADFREVDYGGGPMPYASCGCGAAGPVGSTKEYAAERWNQREHDSTLLRQREELRARLRALIACVDTEQDIHPKSVFGGVLAEAKATLAALVVSDFAK